MSVEIDRQWREEHAKELALTKKRLTELEEENSELAARVHALERWVEMAESDREEEWP